MGQDNRTRNYIPQTSRLIAELKDKGWMITFVATEEDMRGIIIDMKIDESNTFAVQNTAKGFEKAFETSRGATMSYFSARDRGEILTSNFYKKSGKL